MQVHQNDVRSQQLREFNRLDPVARLADNFHIRFHRQQNRRAAPHQCLILRNHDANGGTVDRLTDAHASNPKPACHHLMVLSSVAIMRLHVTGLEVTLVTC